MVRASQFLTCPLRTSSATCLPGFPRKSRQCLETQVDKILFNFELLCLKVTPCSGSGAVVRSEGSGITPGGACRSRTSVVSVAEITGQSSLRSGIALNIRSLGADRSPLTWGCLREPGGAGCGRQQRGVSRKRHGAGAQEGAVGSSGHGRVPGKLSKATRLACRMGAGVLAGFGFALGSGSGIDFFFFLA